MVNEGIRPEFVAIVNYGVIGLIQLAKGFADTTDISNEEALALYDKYITATKELMYAKNHDYGDSFHQTFIEEGMAMARIRLGDKFSRFKTLSRGGGQKVNDESIRDTLIDLANYAIMTVLEMDEAGGGGA